MPDWLLFWGKAITISLIISNLMPYANPVLKIAFRRGFWCCKRKDYQPKTHLNPEFNMERRYATVISTIFIVFTYAFALPMLPITAAGIFMVQYMMDKLLITYYYKERVVHNDLLNRTSLRIIKFGIAVFFLASTYILVQNYCTTYNTDSVKSSVNEFLECAGTNKYVYIMSGCGILNLFLTIFFAVITAV